MAVISFSIATTAGNSTPPTGSSLAPVTYAGTWNAATNTPTIPAAAATNIGQYYVVSVAGTTTVSGHTNWNVGDWLVSNGTSWDYVNNTGVVLSVMGQTGAVTGLEQTAHKGVANGYGSLDANALQPASQHQTGGGNVASNSAYGSGALGVNTTGANNTAQGKSSLAANTTGASNGAFGASALAANTIGSNNSAFGFSALAGNTSGSNNTAFGGSALALNPNGSDQTAVGYTALSSDVTGYGNTGIGSNALIACNGGYYNVAVGAWSGVTITTGIQNVAVGQSALSTLTTGSNNTVIGNNTGRGITTGGGNTVVGGNLNGLAAGLNNAIIIGYYSSIQADFNKSMSGGWKLGGGVAFTTPPAVITTNYTVVDSDVFLTFNNAATLTVTLPSAASYPGRTLWMRSLNTGGVASASANVVPLVGGAAGTAILGPSPPKWALIVSDGSVWQTMAGN